MTTKTPNIFSNLLILTTFFLLLEFSFFVQCNRTYLSDYTFVSDNLHIPITILPGIFYFITAQLSLHLFFCVLVWLLIKGFFNLFNVSAQKQLISMLLIWATCAAFILVANQYYLPNSKFAELTELVLRNRFITHATFYFITTICSGLIFLAAIGWGKFFLKKPTWFIPLVLVSLIPVGIAKYHPHNQLAHQTTGQPNVFIIGIDSLRPDYLSFFGHDKKTPFFDDFLSHATVFSEAVTPLARTFPSWTGILTGEYPKENNVRFNLAQQHHLNLENSLAAIFRRHGYESIFATDETRFSNIDKNFGFNRIITPPMGLNDFLIGTFNDFPLANLIINSHFGKLLFPYSYANRPVYFAYDPNSFVHELSATLDACPQRPLFMTVHFCLPHYPYLWKTLSGNDYNPWQRYQASITRVDKQIRDFYATLLKRHLLDNAIVVILSDHGEALELPGDRITEQALFISGSKQKLPPRFYPPSLDAEAVNQSAGHGTDVLALPQYHSLLAFRIYGPHANQAKTVTGIVSLLDIKPTMLELMQYSAPTTSGSSLSNLIKNNGTSVTANRHIFLESDFSPAAIHTVYPQMREVMLEGIQLFQIDPGTTRLSVKDSMGQMIIHSKQYADIYANWMLALYPQSNATRMPILINLMTGQWTNNLNTTFAQHSPATIMLTKLHAFYGDEIS